MLRFNDTWQLVKNQQSMGVLLAHQLFQLVAITGLPRAAKYCTPSLTELYTGPVVYLHYLHVILQSKFSANKGFTAITSHTV